MTSIVIEAEVVNVDSEFSGERPSMALAWAGCSLLPGAESALRNANASRDRGQGENGWDHLGSLLSKLSNAVHCLKTRAFRTEKTRAMLPCGILARVFRTGNARVYVPEGR
jgi:hypothetical protein